MTRDRNTDDDRDEPLNKPLWGSPSYTDWPRVPHYYGDTVQQLFVVGAALMLFAAPFYSGLLSVQLPFEVGGALILAALAALTNPWSRLLMTANAVAAGVGVVIFELWALLNFHSSTGVQFVFREAIALVFLFAFYFSVRTVRTMIFHEIGHRDTPRDFSEQLAADPNKIHELIDDVDG
jgi:hypothetical protein